MPKLSTDARELVLFTDNDGTLHRQRVVPIRANLKRKMKSGKFNLEKSVAAWMHLANAASQKYKKEIGSAGGRGSHAFPIEVRREASRHWAIEFSNMVANGEL